VATASRNPALDAGGRASSSAAGGETSGCRHPVSSEAVALPFLSTDLPEGGVALPVQGGALDLGGDSGGGVASGRGAVTLALAGAASGGREPSRRGGVSSRLSGNSRAVTTWPRAPLSCGPGPSPMSVTCLAASQGCEALALRGLGFRFGGWAELLRSGVGGF
jgi:hypothetical protein